MTETTVENSIPISPQLGDLWVSLRRQDNGKWEVHVRIFKAYVYCAHVAYAMRKR